MLTPYDEFPVHQSPHAFSHIPSTDYSWDDGYYFGVMSPDDGVFLATGMRVNPNTDMVGGYALLNVRGQQLTVRFNRAWRPDFSLKVGSYEIIFVEPLKKIRLQLLPNDSGLEFDVLWEGTSAPYLEGHHYSENRGRRTTEQSRYSQPGVCSGHIRLRDSEWKVSPDRWTGTRDHSWGLYAARAPLAPDPVLLPPRNAPGPARALRFWTVFRTGEISGFYHFHETADGEQVKMNDVFGTPFEGRLFRGWADEEIELASGHHELRFQPGTRILAGATIHLTDTQGRPWRQEITAAAPPWVVQTMGYTAGSWTDGGTFHTYHGSETLALEWDEFDFSVQPFKFTPYAIGDKARDDFNTGLDTNQKIHGLEYLGDITTIAPDGTTTRGAGQVELMINGRYAPYGFE
ncbi:hypothetical protein [Novosphingobium lentum]|uniref:hypothetical protein n=1 Tax=Novosphingobium lentum TaxID=145287 RepID=UPI00083597B3|nr:hypothetical protein [Novosphingobium lentum]